MSTLCLVSKSRRGSIQLIYGLSGTCLRKSTAEASLGFSRICMLMSARQCGASTHTICQESLMSKKANDIETLLSRPFPTERHSSPNLAERYQSDRSACQPQGPKKSFCSGVDKSPLAQPTRASREAARTRYAVSPKPKCRDTRTGSKLKDIQAW